jgi:hypothetical protein
MDAALLSAKTPHVSSAPADANARSMTRKFDRVWNPRICNEPYFPSRIVAKFQQRGTFGGVFNMVSTNSWFIRARLRTRHLLLLTAIGEEGNIHKAAELLNMSQPAASRLLSDLEEIIGAQLFDRLPRGVRANWYGETMIRHARIVLDRLSVAQHDIDLLKAGLTGHVNVGTICGPAISFVPRAIASVVNEYPLIRIQLLVDSSDQLLGALQNGKIEVMVGKTSRTARHVELRIQAVGG